MGICLECAWKRETCSLARQLAIRMSRGGGGGRSRLRMCEEEGMRTSCNLTFVRGMKRGGMQLLTEAK